MEKVVNGDFIVYAAKHEKDLLELTKAAEAHEEMSAALEPPQIYIQIPSQIPCQQVPDDQSYLRSVLENGANAEYWMHKTAKER